MKFEEFFNLVERLEKLAHENPGSYELRVNALSMLGYAYIIGLLVVFLVMPIAAVVAVVFMPQLLWVLLKVLGKLLIVLAVAAASVLGVMWSLLKSLWVRVDPPTGLELKRDQCPALFGKIDEISDFIKSKRPDHVLVAEDFNASVFSLPRFGIFGTKTYMVLGLPLMQAITPSQFDAVLAHEMGHISEKHGRTALRAARLSETWARFIDAQESSESRLSFLYRKFVSWYFPYFNAYTFVLRRQHEIKADEYAVQMFGAPALGQALINLGIKDKHISDEFWKEVLKVDASDEKPPADVFTKMGEAFRRSDRTRDISNLAKQVAVSTGFDDTHPSLADRLRNIGYWTTDDLPEMPPETVDTAAGIYLGSLEQTLSVELNRVWQERVSDEWKARHETIQAMKKRLAELENFRNERELTEEEKFERINLVLDIKDDKDSLPELEALAAEFPDRGDVRFRIGTVLLAQEKPEGVDQIRRGMELSPMLRAVGNETLYFYFKSVGRDADAKAAMTDMERAQEIHELALQERSAVTVNDRFVPHELPEEEVARLIEKFRYYDEISAAYLVRKRVDYLTDVPMTVLMFELRAKKWIGGGPMLSGAELIDAVVRRLAGINVDYVMIIEKQLEPIIPAVRQIKGSKIYQAQAGP